MRALSTSELLRIWEQGYGEPPYRQGLLLLTAACPEQSPDELAKLSIGRRDDLLLVLRESTFGPKLTGITTCPACGEQVEITVRVDQLRLSVPEETRSEFDLECDEYNIHYRLPCTEDLCEACVSGEKETMREALIQLCILEARCSNRKTTIDQLPIPVIEAVVAGMAEHDPQADAHLALTCPHCRASWDALFDIVSFFWSEIQAWVVRVLREVHILASVYGWREADILAMSPLRRQSYLAMVGV